MNGAEPRRRPTSRNRRSELVAELVVVFRTLSPDVSSRRVLSSESGGPSDRPRPRIHGLPPTPWSFPLVLGEVFSVLDSRGVLDAGGRAGAEELAGVAGGGAGERGRPAEGTVGRSGAAVVGSTAGVMSREVLLVSGRHAILVIVSHLNGEGLGSD